MEQSVERVRVASCPVDRISFDQAIQQVRERIENGVPTHIVFVNAAKVVNYQRNKRLREAMDKADLLLADGVPLVWASRLLGRPLPGRVNGTDLMHALVELAAEQGYRVFFLGARQEVLDRAVRALKVRYPFLVVAGQHHGYFVPDHEDGVVQQIRASRAQLVFLAMSTPLKETWVDANKHRLGEAVFQGVGGSIDVVAGITRRAPVWMQRAGLEWFFRFLQEPRRMWRRYLETNSVFLWLVGKHLAQLCFGVQDQKPAQSCKLVSPHPPYPSKSPASEAQTPPVG
jgi:N-acetylglucosaminyldiphosphoundecaprenol N-acetyl-beta-D-mannosaminyltransferase